MGTRLSPLLAPGGAPQYRHRTHLLRIGSLEGCQRSLRRIPRGIRKTPEVPLAAIRSIGVERKRTTTKQKRRPPLLWESGARPEARTLAPPTIDPERGIGAGERPGRTRSTPAGTRRKSYKAPSSPPPAATTTTTKFKAETRRRSSHVETAAFATTII